jgi:hypothetical protein
VTEKNNTQFSSDVESETTESPARRGIARRTLIKSTAWSVPVIAAAVATPLAAASTGTATLEFGGPYALSGCAVSQGVTVTATSDGTTPVAGTPIVVSLPAGLNWADGTTGDKTVFTDANGQAVLPDINTSAVGATYTLTATGNGTTATGTVTTTDATTARVWRSSDGFMWNFTSVAAGAVAIGHDTYLTAGGDLYFGDQLVASGVSSAATGLVGLDASDPYVTFVQNGVASSWSAASAAVSTFGAVPAGASVLGHATFLTSGGDLYYGNDLIASGVSSATTGLLGTQANLPHVTFVQNGEAKSWSLETGITNTYAAVPAGAVSIGHATYLTSGGDLYYGNDLIASGVSSATTGLLGADANLPHVTFVQNGEAKSWSLETGTTNTYGAVPAGAVSVGHATYLTSGGDLYYGNDLLAAGVVSASAALVGVNKNDPHVTYSQWSC